MLAQEGAPVPASGRLPGQLSMRAEEVGGASATPRARARPVTREPRRCGGSRNTEAGKHPAWSHVTFKMRMDADRRSRTIQNLPEGKRGVVFQKLYVHHPGHARNGHNCSLESSRISNTNMGD